MQQQLQLHTHKLPFQDINRIKNEHFLHPRLGLEHWSDGDFRFGNADGRIVEKNVI